VGTTTDAVARQVIEGGGIPYVVSPRDLPLQGLISSDKDGVTLYEWAP